MVSSRRNGAESDLRLFFWLHWLAGVIPAMAILQMLTLDKVGTVSSQYQLLTMFTFLASVPAFSLAGAFHRNHGYLQGLSRLLGG